MNPAANHCPLPGSAEKARIAIHSFFQRFSFQLFSFAGTPFSPATPISPPSGPASGSSIGLHRESNFLATIKAKMLENLVKRLLPVALASAGFLGTATAETKMTVTGPVVTTGEYLSSHPGLEKKWGYEITNASTAGDINNMFEWHDNAGTNNDILSAGADYDGITGSITSYLSATSSGFTGLLPPTDPFDVGDNKVFFIFILLLTHHQHLVLQLEQQEDL
ncbi:MAG: hypothetical protein NTV46_20630 [Verrucomicrobia bacterium]|nr:hypothetical protein [Verrucomicrobiota bacterium]